MIEPWFQRIVQRVSVFVVCNALLVYFLWQICAQRDIPVIVDEVFTGLWRLGYISGAKMLGIEPDIACYGKLVTGGLVPMGVTLASEDVFDAFEGKDKVMSPLRISSLPLEFSPMMHFRPQLCSMGIPTRPIQLAVQLASLR